MNYIEHYSSSVSRLVMISLVRFFTHLHTQASLRRLRHLNTAPIIIETNPSSVTWFFCEARAKFVLITWVGEKVSPLQKARVSTDKAVLKGVVRDFSVEVFANTLDECEEEVIMKAVIKSMGANYGSSSS